MENARASFFGAACAEPVRVMDLDTVEAQTLADVVAFPVVFRVHCGFVIRDTKRTCETTVRCRADTKAAPQNFFRHVECGTVPPFGIAPLRL